jgi:N4-gp56 family major capsid protein
MATNPVKHGDLTIEQIAYIKKSIITSLRGARTSFWDKFCSHDSVNDGYSAYEWRKLNLPKVKLADLQDMQEGVTPAGLTLEYVNFKVQPVDFGTHIAYTDKSVKYNFDDVRRDASTRLSQHAFETVELRKARQFVSGTCTMTAETDNFFRDLTKARTYLKKNKVTPISGTKYGCILTPEQAGSILEKYQDKITHTSQREAVINGYLGELNGFILFENADEVLYKNETTAYALFIGKANGEMPVKTVSFGNAGVEVYNNALGEGVSVDAEGKVVADHNHQHGSVAYKVMGFATSITYDEAVIRCEYPVTQLELTVEDEDRTGFVKTEVSPK